MTGDRGLLTVVACGAGPAADVGNLVKLAQDAGWRVRVVATPTAVDFIEEDVIEAATGQPVQSRPRMPTPGPVRQPGAAAAVLVAPATFNTIGKLAAGVADTYALVLVSELIGLGVPVVVVPFVNTALAARRPFQQAVRALREEGVRVIFGPDDGWLPHPPGTGSERQRNFPWAAALREIERLTDRVK